MRMLFLVLIFTSFTSFAQSEFRYTLQLVDDSGKLVVGTKLKDQQSVTVIAAPVNPAVWDGKVRYLTLLDVMHGEKTVNVILGGDETVELRDGEAEIASITISAPFGLESFVALITTEKIDFSELYSEGQATRGGPSEAEKTRAVNDIFLLLKNSPVSSFYQLAEKGILSAATLTFEAIPREGRLRGGNDWAEDPGDIFASSVANPSKTFYSKDSSQVLYSPTPRLAINEIDFPVLQLIDPSDTVMRSSRKSNTPKLLFRGIAVDKQSEVRSVSINNVPVSTFMPQTGYFDHSVELNAGVNKIWVTVENAKGYKKSRLVDMVYDPGKTVEKQGSDYLLVIGIDAYSNYRRLNNAVRDAKKFAELMTSEFGFGKNQVYSLYDQDATADNIYHAFDSLSSVLTENDRLLIYFAGHGIYDEKLSLGYWVPVNAATGKLSQLIPNNMISRYIGAFKAKKIFAIVDACYSGTLLGDAGRDVGSGSYSEKVKDFKCRQVLASGRKEVVADGQGEHSPFALTLLNYLKTVASKEILSSDIIDHVKKNVAKNEKQTPVGGALRDVNDESGEFEFVRKKN